MCGKSNRDMYYIEAIKNLRSKKGLSQYEVAELLNISQSTYFQIENGKTELTVKRLYQIAEALNEPVWKVLGLDLEYEKKVDDIEKMMKETAEEMRSKERFINEAIVRLEENKNTIQLLKSTIEDKNRIISILEKATDKFGDQNN